MLKTRASQTYHLAMRSTRMSSEGDVARSGSMHMVATDGMETIVANKTMYLKRKGSWTKIGPIAMSAMQQDLLKEYSANQNDYVASDLGTRTIDETQLHAYAVANNETHRSTTAYVDGSG